MLLHDFSLQSLVWNKLFKRSLFEEKKIRFPKMCFEDLAVMNQVFAGADRVAISNEPLYYYNKHSASTLATIDAKKINDFLRSIAMVRTALEESGEFRKYRRSYWLLTRKPHCVAGRICLRFIGKRKPKGFLGISAICTEQLNTVTAIHSCPFIMRMNLRIPFWNRL